MSDNTPRLVLPELAAAQAQKHVTHNDALIKLDALVDLCLLGQFVDTPPSSPTDGDTYLLGATPTGAWSGNAYKIAYCIDGAWRFYAPFNGLRAYVTPTGASIVYLNGTWTDWTSMINAAEASIASAATCDLGAVGSLFVEITGTTTIAGFGTAANKLRFVRFAGVLTLTHNATSLILPGGADRVTAAGDCAVYASDASGNWRERSYAPAQAVASRDVPAFAVDRNGTDQTGVTTSAVNAIAFNHVAEDNKSWFDTTTGHYTPQSAGLYMIVVSVALNFSASPNDSPQAYIYKNGAMLMGGSYAGLAGGGSGELSVVLGLVRLNGSTDYVEGRCFVPSNTSAIRGDTPRTFMQGFRVAA